MTLEEMGRDYLKQAEALEPRIESITQKINGLSPGDTCNAMALGHELALLVDMYNELTVNGWKLVKYYEKK